MTPKILLQLEKLVNKLPDVLLLERTEHKEGKITISEILSHGTKKVLIAFETKHWNLKRDNKPESVKGNELTFIILNAPDLEEAKLFIRNEMSLKLKSRVTDWGNKKWYSARFNTNKTLKLATI